MVAVLTAEILGSLLDFRAVSQIGSRRSQLCAFPVRFEAASAYFSAFYCTQAAIYEQGKGKQSLTACL